MKLPVFVFVQAVKNGGSLQQIGTLLYHLAAKIKVQIVHFIPLIVENIVANRIDSQQRIDGKYQICFYFQCKYFFPSCATICIRSVRTRENFGLFVRNTFFGHLDDATFIFIMQVDVATLL